MSFDNNNNNQKPNFDEFTDQFKKSAENAKQSAKNAMRTIITILIIFVILGSVGNFVYIVREDEVAVVRQFSNIQAIIVDRDNTNAESQNLVDSKYKDVKIIKDKGLFFKVPFITTVEKETSKLITYQSNPVEINTKDKIKYSVTIFAQYEITHPGLFIDSLGSESKANAFMDDRVYPVVIEKINSLQSDDFLTNKTKLTETLKEGLDTLNAEVASKGITVKDMNVYRTLLPQSNIESTYRKMTAEREAIAQQTRAEGQETYQKTVAETDRKVAEIIAESIEQSEKIIGDADATALEIYSNSFSKDPEFYKFWRSLKAYEKTIDKDTVIYLDKNNAFLKYFNTK